MNMININVFKDFSEFPFGRYENDGGDSGERFRREFLVPALNKKELTIIDLTELKDDVGSSFYEESFGGLIRIEGIDKEIVQKFIKIKAYKKDIEDEILSYIDEAEVET